uniref:B-like cyclin n=1 Tax=Cannabis sativa TaxID=3483 RepID=A0A803NZF8_CANSA
MEVHLGDSLTSFQEHHTSDSIPDLFASEADHMPSRNFFTRFKNRDFYVPFRSEAISHILQAQFSCNLDPFISYLAINYMDRYVSKQEIPQGKPWISKLMVIGCLSLASKMKNSPFSISDIYREEGLVFDAQTVHKMELLILDTLSWRMRSITPFSFFSFFISFIEINDPLSQALKDRASDIIFCSQNDIKFLDYKPSIIAASALLFATHELFIQQFASFKASLLNCQHIKSVRAQVVKEHQGPVAMICWAIWMTMHHYKWYGTKVWVKSQEMEIKINVNSAVFTATHQFGIGLVAHDHLVKPVPLFVLMMWNLSYS